MAQPTTRRENKSMTTAKYSQPSHVRTYEMSVAQARLGPSTSKRRSRWLGSACPASTVAANVRHRRRMRPKKLPLAYETRHALTAYPPLITNQMYQQILRRKKERT